MKLSRNQKRYAGVLGACALALVVDRLFLAPGEADAGERDGAAAPPVAPIAPRDRLQTGVAPRKPLADRFEAIARERSIEASDLSDPFRVPAEWYPEEPSGNDLIVESTLPEVEGFRRAHRLNAVMALEDGGYAIVDGRRLQLGEQINGFELVEIRTRSIVLRSPTFGHVELKLLDTRRPDNGVPLSIRRPE